MVNKEQFPYAGGNGAAVTDAVEDMPWAPAVLSDKGLFLLLLYDKAISCMNEALVMIERGDMVGKGDRLIHAQEIVLQLSDALDKSTGSIADNLERLYLYVYRRLIEGNVRLDRNAILEAKGIMADLYDAWQAIILGQDSSRPGDSWET
ncbi:MAG: flagellar export chaperone FliS, partial [bacterium]|nr:flagellar export chaperone FliS [bacterium]